MMTIPRWTAIALLVIAVRPAAGQQPTNFDKLKISIERSQPWDAAVEAPNLLVHFHGAAETTAENFHRSGLSGILVTINCNGLSSAYRKPFEDQTLFDYVLRHAKRELVNDGHLRTAADWRRIDVSCFSAGYGAVRELLKNDAIVERIDAVIAADSIYASIHLKDGQRLVDQEQMRPFLNFAGLAVDGTKTFLLSHSQLPVEPYASTVETADYLLQEIGCDRQQSDSAGQTFEPISMARKGQFAVFGYAGADGAGHLKHLRHIGDLWRRAHELR